MKTNKFTRLFKTIYQIIEYIWFMYIKGDAVLFSKRLGVKIGNDCQILANPLKVFGTEPWLIKIGNHVDITSGVKFITHEGGIWCARGIEKKYNMLDTFAPIVVGDNVLIGLDSLIMPGVTVGNNVIIAAHSVVTKDIPDNTVVAGVPAKSISTIDLFMEKLNKREFFQTKNMSAKEKKKYLQSIHPEWFE